MLSHEMTSFIILIFQDRIEVLKKTQSCHFRSYKIIELGHFFTFLFPNLKNVK
jgi:hypothetical protein